MKSSQALAKSTGASACAATVLKKGQRVDLTRARAEIMRTSSSDFMMRLIRASGRSLCVLKLCSDVISSCSMSMLCSFQNFLRNACICRTCLRRGGRALT